MFALLLLEILALLPLIYAKKECPLACPIRCAPKPPKRPLFCAPDTAFKLVSLLDEQFFTFLNNQQYYDAVQSLGYDAQYNITSYYHWNCQDETGLLAEWIAGLNDEQFESRPIKMEYIESTGEVIVDSFVVQYFDLQRKQIKVVYRSQRTWYANTWCDYQLKNLMLWDVHCAHSRYVVTDWDCNVPRCIHQNMTTGIVPLPPLPPLHPFKPTNMYRQDRS